MPSPRPFPGLQRNFPEVPGRVTPCREKKKKKRRRGGDAGRRVVAARERERQRNPVSFPDTHKSKTAPWLPLYRSGRGRRERTTGSCYAPCNTVGSREKKQSIWETGEKHFPSQRGHAEWVGAVGLGWQRSAPLPARQRSTRSK